MGGEVVTPLDLQAIREACEKATAGPWYAMSVIIDFGDENGKSVVCERPVQRISYRGTPQTSNELILNSGGSAVIPRRGDFMCSQLQIAPV